MAHEPPEPPLITDFGEVTIERLEQGVKNAALIVETCGEEYVGILDRLTADLEQMKRLDAAYQRAMAYPVSKKAEPDDVEH